MFIFVIQFRETRLHSLLHSLEISGTIISWWESALLEEKNDKLYKLLGDIKGVKTFIDNMMVICRDGFPKHIYHLRFIFAKLCQSKLKVCIKNIIFCLRQIPYQGCKITFYGIKHFLKKLPEIMDLERPTNTTEVIALICMVQYCKYLCLVCLHLFFVNITLVYPRLNKTLER